MPKKKRQSSRKSQSQTGDARKQGWKAFSANNFEAAISLWSQLDQRDPPVAHALAEAYFRLGLRREDYDSRLKDMQQAHKLAPDDLRYYYHLGLALHHKGDARGALQIYRAVLQQRPNWSGAGLVLALAELQASSRVDLAQLSGSSPAIRERLAPVQALLRGEVPPEPTTSDDAEGQFWRGLGLINAGDGAALPLLAADMRLPTPQMETVRSLYQGVAAMQQGDAAEANRAWCQAYAASKYHPSWLLSNLAVSLVEHLQAAVDADDTARILDLVDWVQEHRFRHSALNPVLLQALDRAAHAEAASGQWTNAVLLWEDARQLVSGSSSLGSPRLLLHNLAVAYEMLEEWVAAAEMWRAMLRTRPRKSKSQEEKAADPMDYTDEQWAWVRKRVIACYQHAGQPGEAVKIFRQAIKTDPDDLDMRVQLVDALLANEQEQAAFNELDRITQREPQHIEAHLRLADLHGSMGHWGAAEHSLRVVLDQQPEREDVRRQVAKVMLARGRHFHDFGLLPQAKCIFEEGQAFAPHDYQFPLNLARVAFDEHNMQQAKECIERTLELGADDPHAYVLVIDFWAVADELGRAQYVLERAQRDMTLTIDFYIELVAALLVRSAPRSALSSGMFTSAPPQPVEGPWLDMARDAVQRAVALKPNDPQVRFQLASVLMQLKPDMALEQAEAGVEMAPDQPVGLMLLGILQGLNDQNRQAKSTLRNAAKLARQQGLLDLADQAEMMRQQVGSPFFRLSLQMGAMIGDIDEDEDDFFL